jgi:hypothetical protein
LSGGAVGSLPVVEMVHASVFISSTARGGGVAFAAWGRRRAGEFRWNFTPFKA